MRHVRIERWSRIVSVLHARHPAAKIAAAFALLICIATLSGAGNGRGNGRPAATAAVYLAMLVAATVIARLPVQGILGGAAAVLPFALCFAVVSLISGEPERAVWLVVRSYLSSLTAILLIATTGMPDLLAGFEYLRAPRFLLEVMQFLYRYLIVLLEEAGAMRDAGLSRAGNGLAGTLRSLEVRKAAGAAGVLFARSYLRAQAIHRAMVARGFEGHIPRFSFAAFRPADAVFAALIAGLAIAVRTVLA